MDVFFVEDVFKTEGVPAYTFIEPPNYHDILMDIRSKTKPVIIEGQSGSGKTTTVKHIIENDIKEKSVYLTPRAPDGVEKIVECLKNKDKGIIIIDDFHRLDDEIQNNITDLLKYNAEAQDIDSVSKFIIIGINKVGSKLISFANDIAKRCGIHTITPGTNALINDLVDKGAKKLNITIREYEQIFSETKGDYWLTQLFCKTICADNKVTQTQQELTEIVINLNSIRAKVIAQLHNGYSTPVKEFCRGTRFRPGNDPYFKLLRAISRQDNSGIDLNLLAANDIEAGGSINNIKEKRLPILLESKPLCKKYFFYNKETKFFAIEDPALFYYLKFSDWNKLRSDCGFKEESKEHKFDFAISFAGEQRALADILSESLEILDCSVFYDQWYEINLFGKAWSAQFKQIFSEDCKYVICILDVNYSKKIWPTFEKEIFQERIKTEAVIPIYLDDTPIVGIPKDIIGLDYRGKPQDNVKGIADEIAIKIEEFLRMH